MTAALKPGHYEHRYRILFSVMLGIIMAPIDASMVNVILPTLTEAFSSDVATAQWVPMTYLLIISSTLLFFGRLGDISGYKKVFLWGLAGFVAASALCGLATSMYWLIVFRCLQGIGAAMIMAVPLALITACFPPNELGRALGTYSISISAGLAIGPSFGGFIASALGWRFTFLINIPVGILALFVAYKIIPDLEGERSGHDIPGALAAFVFLFFLLLFINRSQQGTIDLATEGLLLVALVAGVSFVWREKTARRPMLNLDLFRNMTFTFASISALLNFMAQYVVVFLAPFYLHRVLDLPPGKVGLIMTCFPLAVMAVATPSGRLSDRIGSRLLSCLGSLICALSLYLLSGLPATASTLDVSLRLALFGLGTGIFQSPNTSAAMGGVPRLHLGVASAILANARNVGMVMGIALAGVVLHVYVPDEILGLHHLDPQEAKLFLYGIEMAFGAGAVISVCTAVTSLVKKPRNAGNEDVVGEN